MRRLSRTKEFIKLLLDEVNKLYTCYYEKNTKNASYPYLVIPTLNISSLDSGDQCFIDIEIYSSEFASVSVEDICDDLRNHLTGLSICKSNIGFHLGFENQNISKINEQDLIPRKVSFSARIFSI